MIAKVAIPLGVLVVGTAGYGLFVPTPSGGLVKPKIAALAGLGPRSGCGLVALNHASATTLYDIGASPALQRKIDTEMLGKGFRKAVQTHGVSYSRSISGLLPTRQFVVVYSDGRVLVGVRKSKWPFLNP